MEEQVKKHLEEMSKVLGVEIHTMEQELSLTMLNASKRMMNQGIHESAALLNVYSVMIQVGTGCLSGLLKKDPATKEPMHIMLQKMIVDLISIHSEVCTCEENKNSPFKGTQVH